jgi:hypothetical protein
VVTEEAFRPSHWMCCAPFPPGATHVVLGVVVCRWFPIYSFLFHYFLSPSKKCKFVLFLFVFSTSIFIFLMFDFSF